MASAFEFYLRTGRRKPVESLEIQTKFNPWHDPDDGRFTFAGQGRHFGGGHHDGHLIAARFNGPREWFNHFAQDANFNRGAYLALENQWAKSIRSGRRVFVDIVPHYRGTSMRPYRLVVTSIIDGKKRVADSPNEKQGR